MSQALSMASATSFGVASPPSIIWVNLRCSGTIVGFGQTLVTASAVLLMGLAFAPTAALAQEPQRGGILKVSLYGDPPSLDMHQEQTFLVTIPMSTVYNTLVMFDPHGFPNIIGDLAKSWERSEDGTRWQPWMDISFTRDE